MKKIYIILMHTKTLPAKMIQKATKYKYTHVVISLDKECDKIYSFGRKTLNNILNCGFTIEQKNGAFFQKFNQTECRIYELSITKEKYQKMKELLDFMEQNKDTYKYDFIGLFLRYWNITIPLKNHYVCSYFVASLLEQTNITHFSKKTALVRPQDFELLENSRVIYEGLYQKYTSTENNFVSLS